MSISYVNAQSWSDWSSWKTTSCFKGVDFKLNPRRQVVEIISKMTVEFRNRYYEDVHLNYDAEGGSYTTKNNRLSVRAGETKRIMGLNEIHL